MQKNLADQSIASESIEDQRNLVFNRMRALWFVTWIFGIELEKKKSSLFKI